MSMLIHPRPLRVNRIGSGRRVRYALGISGRILDSLELWQKPPEALMNGSSRRSSAAALW